MQRTDRQRQLLKTIWEALSPVNEQGRTESASDWETRRLASPPAELLAKLLEEFRPEELQDVGVAATGEDGRLTPSARWTRPDLAVLPLQHTAGGPPFDLLLRDGLLIGDEPAFWALTGDFRIIAHHQESEGQYLLVPTLEDVVACHRLGLAAAPLPSPGAMTQSLLRCLVDLPQRIARCSSTAEVTAPLSGQANSPTPLVDAAQLLAQWAEHQNLRQQAERIEQDVEQHTAAAAMVDAPPAGSASSSSGSSGPDVSASDRADAVFNDSDFPDSDFPDSSPPLSKPPVAGPPFVERPLVGPRLGVPRASPRVNKFPVAGSAVPKPADGNFRATKPAASETVSSPPRDPAETDRNSAKWDDAPMNVQLLVTGWSFVEARRNVDQTFLTLVDELTLAVRHGAADLDHVVLWIPQVAAEERIRFARRLGDRDLERATLCESLDAGGDAIPTGSGQKPPWEVDSTPPTLAELHTQLFRLLRNPRSQGALLSVIQEKYFQALERELIQPLLDSVASVDNPLHKVLRLEVTQLASCLHAQAPALYTTIFQSRLDPTDKQGQVTMHSVLKVHVQLIDRLSQLCKATQR